MLHPWVTPFLHRRLMDGSETQVTGQVAGQVTGQVRSGQVAGQVRSGHRSGQVAGQVTGQVSRKNIFLPRKLTIFLGYKKIWFYQPS